MNMPPMPERLWFATAARSKRAAEVSVATAGRQWTGVSLRRMPRQRNLQRSLRLSISKQRLREFAENQNLEGGHASQHNPGRLVVDRPRCDCAGNRRRRDAAAARERKRRAAKLAHDPS